MFGKNKKKNKEKKDFFGEQWKEEELIGEGSYGKVYKAKKEEFGITTYSAIKQIEIPQSKAEVQTLKTEGMTSSDITNYYEKSVQKWVDEIKFMSIFRDSENVVNIEDYEILKKKDAIGWIINIRMELLTNLDSYILENNVTDKEILKMAIDVSNALIDCEENEVIHRDIKPDNIFINKKGVYKVGDFGIAKKIEKTVSNMSKKGTENYMAPELYKNERGNRTVDIYSLGIMLYRYFNYNRLPFLPDYPNEITIDSREEALYERISGEKMKAPQNASREISEIILKACSYYPKDRYSSAVELKADLEKVYEKIEKPIVLFDFDAKKMNKIFLENTKSETHDSTINILTGMQENSKTGEVKIVDLPPEAVGATVASSGAEQAIEGTVEKAVEAVATAAVTTGAIVTGATIENAEEVASTASDVALSGADVAGDIHNKTRNMFDGKKELNEEPEIKESNIENEVGNAEVTEIEEKNELEGSEESKEADVENEEKTESTENSETQESSENASEKDTENSESEVEKREEEQQEGDKEENSENKIKSQFGIKLKSYRKKIIIIILLLLIIIAIALLMIYKPWEPEVVEEEKVSVPSVIGMTSSEAIIALGDAGLEIEYEYVETDNEDEVGLVIEQSIGESEEVSKGTVIKLTIAVSKEKVSVISVVGLTMEEAVNKLEELGLKVSITEQYNDEVEAEIVISQMTAEGEEVSKGTVIELLVSMGPESTESEETTTNTSSTVKNTASTSTSSTGTVSTGTTSSSSDTSSSGTSGSSGGSSSGTSDSSSSSSSTSSSSSSSSSSSTTTNTTSSSTTTTETVTATISSTEVIIRVGSSTTLTITVSPSTATGTTIHSYSWKGLATNAFSLSYGSRSIGIKGLKRGAGTYVWSLKQDDGTYVNTDTVKIYVIEDGAGDLDGDGDVDMVDAAKALDFYKYGGATDADLLVGDIDYDGDIDATDAALITDMYKYGVS